MRCSVDLDRFHERTWGPEPSAISGPLSLLHLLTLNVRVRVEVDAAGR